jgi:hypothetical protein
VNATSLFPSTVCLAAALLSASSHAARSESENFVVVSHSRAFDADETARLCESLGGRLKQQWCPDSVGSVWSPKCEVIIHSSRQSYLAAAGFGGAQTHASSYFQPETGTSPARRRIDIRGDGSLGMAALPHELTHLVLADVFVGQQPPRWADEGLAVLADSQRKQALHERDLTQAIARRTEFRMVELLALESYPEGSRIPAFYGQSASVAAFLLERGDSPQFVEFLNCAQESGYDQALRRIYALDGVNQLERAWRAWRQQTVVTK